MATNRNAAAKVRCSAKIYTLGGHSYTCSRRGVVERGGQWYCKQHDPVARMERRAAKNAEWAQRLDRQQKVWGLDHERQITVDALVTMLSYAMDHAPASVPPDLLPLLNKIREIDNQRAALSRSSESPVEPT